MYQSLRQCVLDLEKNGHLVRIKEETDPELEMAAIHLRVNAAKGPALLFEKVKGSNFQAVSNLFGTLERSRFIFRDTLENVKKLMALKENPMEAVKHPFKHIGTFFEAFRAFPKQTNPSLLSSHILPAHLPLIKCWPGDGGAFITLPQVYTEDAEKPGIMNSNLGMYRIQLSGNSYIQNKEIGIHYQIHRGIGVHQAKSNAKGLPLKVSIFIGGPPAHTLAAVMPLPEGMSELTFAGVLAGRRFRYYYDEGYLISADAGFVITGDVYPGENKPEGPFGDHLGYYSLRHDFPVMKVRKVYHRQDAVYPFTVVGRPPQEDSVFGALIHEITGKIIPKEIPGLHQVNAVDAAGVHPLLLAVGSERYTPFMRAGRPQEILTIASHILGYGQLSLAKYLFIAAREDDAGLNANDIKGFFRHVLERVDFTRDLHFHTHSSIDTLDYSGTGLNSGSKVVIAAAGEKKRELADEIPGSLISGGAGFVNPKIVMPGVLAIQPGKYQDEKRTQKEIEDFSGTFRHLFSGPGNQLPLIVFVDDADFASRTISNFLWVTFTRSNPSHDIHGIDNFVENKHWGCRGSVIIDARIKPHHAPPLLPDERIEKRVDELGARGKSLYGII